MNILTAILFSVALDTTSSNVDTLVVIPSAIQIQAVEVNKLQKDTATQITWYAFDLSRDTTKGCNTYVQFYNKYGKRVYVDNCPIPAEIVNQWGTSNDIIDTFILNKYGILRKTNK